MSALPPGGPTREPSHLPGAAASVELLERALSYTRPVLATVRPGHLARATPCVRWDLDDLLWHMDDALDAFAEAAGGVVPGHASWPVRPSGGPRRPRGVEARLLRLRDKACHLLGVWVEPPGAPVRVPGVAGSAAPLLLPAPVLAATAAVEITVHGWDVAQATGTRRPIPATLAQGLLPVAVALAEPDGDRFGAVVPVAAAAGAEARLLGRLGRVPRPGA